MDKTANASVAGYAAFAITLWINSMVPADWFGMASPASAPLLAMALGGCVLALAGIGQFLRGRTLDSSLFLLFAAYWWVAALARHDALAQLGTSAGFLGWYELVWAFFAFCLWLAARRDDLARMLFTLGLCLSLLALALAQWLQMASLTVLGGYLGLVAAIVGIYIATAELVNETHGHVVLPLGEVRHP